MGSMASSSPPGSADEPHDGAARLTGEQVSAINRFPDDNPNPVMRYDADGHLIYANPASAPHPPGDRRRASVSACRPTSSRASRPSPRSRGFVEFTWQSRTYAVWPVPIEDLDFTNLYGMDVTAERAIVKFPDQNPNPVMRIDWDGTLVYANPASAGLVAGLDLAIGERARRPTCATPCSSVSAPPTGRRSRSRPAAGATPCCRSTSPSSASSTSMAPTSPR